VSTVAIILAADAAPGFSGPKYLAVLRGKSLLQHVVDDAAEWPVDDVIVTLGSDAEELVDTIDFGDCTVVIDPGWAEGSASPLRAALDLASRDRAIRRCVVARGDQPGIDRATVGALIDVAVETSADAVMPKYRYALGWPIVLDYSIWEHLLGGEGSVDLHDVVASHASAVEEVWYDRLSPPIYESPDDFPSIRR
jgi:CTP:molybdopterin cytidylyltransferase MocA